MTLEEKEEARKALEAKDYKIVGQSEEPFHGLPAFELVYEGTQDGRFVRGQDIWVFEPQSALADQPGRGFAFAAAARRRMAGHFKRHPFL